VRFPGGGHPRAFSSTNDIARLGNAAARRRSHGGRSASTQLQPLVELLPLPLDPLEPLLGLPPLEP